jgi:hypothetical protein
VTKPQTIEARKALWTGAVALRGMVRVKKVLEMLWMVLLQVKLCSALLKALCQKIVVVDLLSKSFSLS